MRWAASACRWESSEPRVQPNHRPWPANDAQYRPPMCPTLTPQSPVSCPCPCYCCGACSPWSLPHLLSVLPSLTASLSPLTIAYPLLLLRPRPGPPLPAFLFDPHSLSLFGSVTPQGRFLPDSQLACHALSSFLPPVCRSQPPFSTPLILLIGPCTAHSAEQYTHETFVMASPVCPSTGIRVAGMPPRWAPWWCLAPANAGFTPIGRSTERFVRYGPC